MDNIKIKDLQAYHSYTISLILTSCTARKTKKGKDYLACQFLDGRDTINGNYWDWKGANIPEVNMVLDVTAKVVEWQGNLQLSISHLSTNTTLDASHFMPQPPVDIEYAYEEAQALLDTIKDEDLQILCQRLLREIRGKWLTIPGAQRIHHAYVGGTLVHSLSVAKIAKAIATNIPEANVSLCTAGGILHDIGKLFSYRFNGVVIDRTDEGSLYGHTFVGARLVSNFAEAIEINNDTLVQVLTHIILSHHRSLEYGAAVEPACLEAFIVHYADTIDATAEMIQEASGKIADHAQWTGKIWALNNRPILATQYVNAAVIQ